MSEKLGKFRLEKTKREYKAKSEMAAACKEMAQSVLDKSTAQRFEKNLEKLRSGSGHSAEACKKLQKLTDEIRDAVQDTKKEKAQHLTQQLAVLNKLVGMPVCCGEEPVINVASDANCLKALEATTECLRVHKELTGISNLLEKQDRFFTDRSKPQEKYYEDLVSDLAADLRELRPQNTRKSQDALKKATAAVERMQNESRSAFHSIDKLAELVPCTPHNAANAENSTDDGQDPQDALLHAIERLTKKFESYLQTTRKDHADDMPSAQEIQAMRKRVAHLTEKAAAETSQLARLIKNYNAIVAERDNVKKEVRRLSNQVEEARAEKSAEKPSRHSK